MAKEWFWIQGEAANGPAEIDELAALHHRGELPPATFVWRDGEEKRPLRDVLDELGKLPPPLPPEPTSLPEFLKPDSFTYDELPSEWKAKGWTRSEAHPWRRYFARMLDTMINGGMVLFISAMVWTLASPATVDGFVAFADNRIASTVLSLIAAMPVSALLIGLTGTSFGKLVFGIRVVGKNYRPIGFLSALNREFHVWYAGLGLGLPLISLITLSKSYNNLDKSGNSPWDRSRNVLLYRPGGFKSTALVVVGVIVLILMIVILQTL